MRKLTYFVASSIDGFIASPGHSHEMFTEGRDHGDWALTHYPETVPTHVRALVPGLDGAENQHFDTVLMGRGTYERGLRDGVTAPYAHLRQYVVSGSMAGAPDPAVRLIGEDPVAAVRELKRQDGMGIWLCGGGKLAATLRSETDELIVKINPVVMGSGVPLFDSAYAPEQYAVTSGTVYNSGVTVMTYAKRC